MAGVLVKGSKAYDYVKAVKGPSYIRLYNEQGLCFKHFLDISEVGFTNFLTYRLTKDTSAVSGKTYYIRSGDTFTVSSFSTSAYELVTDDYEIPNVEGFGIVYAENGNIEDGKLYLTLPTGKYLQNKLQINFRSPVASKELSHVIIEDVIFELVDTCGYCVNNYSSAFLAESIVTIIIDMDNKKAVVENLLQPSKIKVSNEQPSADEDVDFWINTSSDSFGLEVDSEVKKDSTNLITSGAVYEFVMKVIKDLGLSSNLE